MMDPVRRKILKTGAAAAAIAATPRVLAQQTGARRSRLGLLRKRSGSHPL